MVVSISGISFLRGSFSGSILVFQGINFYRFIGIPGRLKHVMMLHLRSHVWLHPGRVNSHPKVYLEMISRLVKVAPPDELNGVSWFP